MKRLKALTMGQIVFGDIFGPKIAQKDFLGREFPGRSSKETAQSANFLMTFISI